MKRKLILFLLIFCMISASFPSIVFAEGLENIESIENTESEYSEETDIALQRIEDLSDAGVDFSTKRLIVKGSKKELKDEPVIANIDNIYLLQYDEYMDAIDAYYRLSETSDSVEFDTPISVATGVGIASNLDVEFVPMTEEENPFVEADNVETDKIEYDVAVIDTGANKADKIVSVLGDDGKDNHGHGQTMINTIKKHAPNAKVLSIKALNDEGYGDTSAIYAAIKLAIDEKVNTINLSVSALSTENNFIIEEAIAEARAKGITVVGAAGNNGIDAELTVPGKIQDAIIVGTTSKNSNTGDTVDYYVAVDSTSIAAATVTGLILSDTLNDYEIVDKVINLKEENNEDPSETTEPTEPSDEFTPQDGGGGAGGSGNAGGTSATWTSTFGRKYAYVWYDRGGWEETGQAGSLRAPAQGYYQNGWHDNPNGKSTYEFFINLLTNRIEEDTGHNNLHYDGQWAQNKTAVARENDAMLKDTMKTACQRAISRNNNPKFKSARVVGVAVTYRAGNVTAGGGHKYSNIWSILTWSGDKSFKNMMRAPKDREDDRGLSSKYGWSAAADPNKVNGVQDGENWRDYTYRIASADNASFPANNGTLKPRVYVVAVSDDFPPNKVSVQIKKAFSNTTIVSNNPLYSLNGVVFKLYKSQADARSDSGAEATFTINAQGVSNKQDVAPGKYYLVEIGPPKLGVTIPNVLKASNGGYPLDIVANSTFSIGEAPLTGSYTASYQYTCSDGTLPSQVMSTLPSSQTYANGSLVTAPEPSNTEITIGDKVYEFLGWDAPQKVIYNSNITFTGRWAIEDVFVDDPDSWDDDYLVNYDYVLEDAEEDEEIPDEVWETIPADYNDEYGVGDTVTALEPSDMQITVDDITYVFVGWDKTSDTFSSTNKTITFTGTWRKN